MGHKRVHSQAQRVAASIMLRGHARAGVQHAKDDEPAANAPSAPLQQAAPAPNSDKPIEAGAMAMASINGDGRLERDARDVRRRIRRSDARGGSAAERADE